MAILTVEDKSVPLEDPNDTTITLDMENDDAPATVYRCRTCREVLFPVDEGRQWIDEYSAAVVCPDAEEDGGPHTREREPLTWVNSVSVETDPDKDSVTLSISVDDPRGAFTFTVYRVPDNADFNAGRLILSVPHPDQPKLHAPLEQVSPGWYVIRT